MLIVVGFTSHGQRRHLEMAPHLLSLAKDMKVGFYTDSPRIEPWAIAWQSITHYCSTPAPYTYNDKILMIVLCYITCIMTTLSDVLIMCLLSLMISSKSSVFII